MSLRYALLGMLAYAPASGYDLTKSFEGELGTYAWQTGHTRIYPELNKLAEEGLIEVADEGARGRRTYRVTPQGRTALRSWLFEEPQDHSVRNVGVLRLFLMSALEPGDTRRLLRAMLAEGRAEIDKLTEAISDLDASPPADGRLPFGRLAAEYGLRMHQARLEWAQWALEHTESDDKDDSPA